MKFSSDTIIHGVLVNFHLRHHNRWCPIPVPENKSLDQALFSVRTYSQNKTWSTVSNSINRSYPSTLDPYPSSLIPSPCSLTPSTVPFKVRLLLVIRVVTKQK